MMGYRLRTPKKCHKNVFEYTKINIEIQISHLFFPINKYLKKNPHEKISRKQILCFTNFNKFQNLIR